MFHAWKNKLAWRRFMREYRNYKRSGRVYNLDEARSMGILFNAGTEESFSIVKKYIKYLREEEGIKRISAIGWFDDRKIKQLPEYLVPKLDYDFITPKKNVKRGKPSGNTVNNFCTEDFEILIDLTLKKELPLLYMLNRSKARFKVGAHQTKMEPFYDLMIITNHNNSLTDLIDNTNAILKKINKVYETRF